MTRDPHALSAALAPGTAGRVDVAGTARLVSGVPMPSLTGAT